MKWIKVFEEFDLSYKDAEKIEDLSQLCLVNLIDDGFKVTTSAKSISILIPNWISEKDRLFDYNKVKDHIIPFVKLLSKDYDIDHIFFMGGWKKKSWLDKRIDNLKGTQSGSRERKEVSVQDLISDKAKINFQVITITIKIK